MIIFRVIRSFQLLNDFDLSKNLNIGQNLIYNSYIEIPYLEMSSS